MDHLKRVADEFGRQAQTFEKWAEKTDDQVAPRFQAALGAAVGGHLLDVACGPGVVTVDIVSSQDPAESNLQNAIERLRDPSHVRMLPAPELDACMTQAGFENIEGSTWDKDREFEEWMGIVNDPTRVEPLRTGARKPLGH
jgi:hypothetical protein